MLLKLLSKIAVNLSLFLNCTQILANLSLVFIKLFLEIEIACRQYIIAAVAIGPLKSYHIFNEI